MTQTLLKSILTFAMLGEKCAEQVIIDNGLKFNAKNKMEMIGRRFKGVINDITQSTSEEYSNIIRAEVTENWESFSFMNILHIVMMMIDEERATVEKFCAQLLALRSNNELHN